MATFAEYERELLQKRVQTGVNAAKTRGVKFRRPSSDAERRHGPSGRSSTFVEAEGLGVVETARNVVWSKATFYRHRGAG